MMEDTFATIPDEGIIESDEIVGTIYALKSGAHFYERVNLSDKILEDDIGKVPLHCQHMFGSLKKICSMPGLYLQIESRINQVWYDFLKFDQEGDRIPVHMRLANRVSRLKNLNKTVEDVKCLFNNLGRELFLAYDLQYYLKFTGYYRNKKGYCKDNLNVWKFEKFPTTYDSWRTWTNSQGDTKFLDKIASYSVDNYESLKKLGFGIVPDPRTFECADKQYDMLPSVLLASNVLSMIDLILNWYAANNCNNVTYREDMWNQNCFYTHLITNMCDFRDRHRDDTSSYLMWKIDPNGRIRLGEEMRVVFISLEVFPGNEEEFETGGSPSMIAPPQPSYFIYSAEQHQFRDYYFDHLKKIFRQTCHIGYIIINRLMVIKDRYNRDVESSLYILPKSNTSNDANVNFGLIFDSHSAIKTMIKNSKKAYKSGSELERAVLSNYSHWQVVRDDSCVVFTHSGVDEDRMIKSIRSKKYKEVFSLASTGIITLEFLLFLMREKVHYNRNIRCIKDRNVQLQRLRNRYKMK